MKFELFYFNIEYAVKIHDWIIENSGGLNGQREIVLLESALEHIQNDTYYPTFEKKLRHLAYAVNKFHPFNDGNKRSSLVLGAYFLELNGYGYCIDKFIQEMENIVVWLSEGKIDDELLLEIIISIINEDEFNEFIKLRIIEVVGL
ncbi:type II toxin-antitoxin system death-on-curing family toxin [Candidatus Acidulodesulfobacterium sp. H_13]|uniref:type II toxin-antitoxin system death-on-curing family toxin n=1 Tax=Candidatus Acidulodesulfobacterium sp. H_13 TaxID=3395470 RepID=UPI003AF4AC60